MKIYTILLILFLFLVGCTSAKDQANIVDVQPTVIEEQIPEDLSFTPTPVLPPPLEGDIEIQQLLLTSHNRWKTLKASYTETLTGAGIESGLQVKNHEIIISQPANFQVQTSSTGDSKVIIRISDGNEIVDSNGDRYPVPEYVYEPFDPPNYPSDTVYPHPLAGYLSTAVSDLIFPAGLAQRGGTYRQVGQELIAGRDALVVEWSREPGKLIDRFWVDSQTGVILHQQNFGKEQNTSPMLDIQVNSIVFDVEISAQTFDLGQVPTPPPTPLPPEPGTASITVLDLKGILNVRSGPNTGYKVITTLEPGETLPVIGRNEAGDWWKIDLGDQDGWVFGAFVEFQGDLDLIPITDY